MKRELRPIFGDYINSGEEGYFLLKNRLKEGISLSFLSSIDLEKNIVEDSVFYILLNDLKDYLRVADSSVDAFNHWSKLLIFTDDVVSFKISQNETMYTKKTKLDGFNNYLITAKPVLLSKPQFISFTLKLHKDSFERTDIEDSFFGKNKKERALEWKNALLKSSRYYIDELLTIEQISTEESLTRQSLELKEVFEKRLSLWGSFENLQSLQKNLYLTDFGIKDLALLWAFKEHFCSNNFSRESKSIEIIRHTMKTMAEDQRKTLDFFQK